MRCSARVFSNTWRVDIAESNHVFIWPTGMSRRLVKGQHLPINTFIYAQCIEKRILQAVTIIATAGRTIAGNETLGVGFRQLRLPGTNVSVKLSFCSCFSLQQLKLSIGVKHTWNIAAHSCLCFKPAVYHGYQEAGYRTWRRILRTNILIRTNATSDRTRGYWAAALIIGEPLDVRTG